VSDWNPTDLFAGSTFRAYVSDLRETASFGSESGSSADNETPNSDMEPTPDSNDATNRIDPLTQQRERDRTTIAGASRSRAAEAGGDLA
jgi:hypothetical protein